MFWRAHQTRADKTGILRFQFYLLAFDGHAKRILFMEKIFFWFKRRLFWITVARNQNYNRVPRVVPIEVANIIIHSIGRNRAIIQDLLLDAYTHSKEHK